jgi:hypothetical protein
MPDASGRKRHWILEIHFVDRAREIGGFYEELLTIGVSFSTNVMVTTLPEVRGVNLDPRTRCEHYHGPTDIIAIKMKCCGVYYACKDCHDALTDHQREVWDERHGANEPSFVAPAA